MGAPLRRGDSPPLRLSVVLLPRSVDVVEERHGERHAQELWRQREGDSKFVSGCIEYTHTHTYIFIYFNVCFKCVPVRSFWCRCLGLYVFLMHNKSWDEARAHISFCSLSLSLSPPHNGLQTRALESFVMVRKKEKRKCTACTSIKSMKWIEMPLNQSSQLSLWSFHYPWYFYIKHCHKADPKTIIWWSLDGGENRKVLYGA